MKTIYSCKLIRLIDGDTVDIYINLGLGIFTAARIRLAGVDAPEIVGVPAGGQEYAAGMAAKKVVYDFYCGASPIQTVQVFGRGVYGRLVGEISDCKYTMSLNQILINAGYKGPEKLNLRGRNLYTGFPGFKTPDFVGSANV